MMSKARTSKKVTAKGGLQLINEHSGSEHAQSIADVLNDSRRLGPRTSSIRPEQRAGRHADSSPCTDEGITDFTD
jgi:hypothetical protein